MSDFEPREPRNSYIMAKQLEWSRSSMNDPCRELIEILNAAFAGEDDEPSSYAVGETLKVLLRIPDRFRSLPDLRLVPTVNRGIHIRYRPYKKPSLVISIPVSVHERHYITHGDTATGEPYITNYAPDVLEYWLQRLYGEPST